MLTERTKAFKKVLLEWILIQIPEKNRSLHDHETTNRIPKQTIQKQLQVKSGKMNTNQECEFSKLNNKRYYFSDGIVSLPIKIWFLEEVRKYKKDSEEKAQDLFLSNKYDMLRLEYKPILRN